MAVSAALLFTISRFVVSVNILVANPCSSIILAPIHPHTAGTHDDSSSDEKIHDAADITERRRSESDPVNLSLGYRERHDEDSNDGHIDVETIGNAPSKVSSEPDCTRPATAARDRNRYSSKRIRILTELDTGPFAGTVPIQTQSIIPSTRCRYAETTARTRPHPEHARKLCGDAAPEAKTRLPQFADAKSTVRSVQSWLHRGPAVQEGTTIVVGPAVLLPKYVALPLRNI